ncbi:hypothetical protein TSOC_002149 [Tetrabaena socialis]|uniref:Bromo domain-containing protein n=1 Tax=Tetrabaena socialis TaxID=47790 RepID=A0A2J8AEY1_9CHLO|nr:hypothetical protein TSOC_002149 [Tetrabaena socialis]|eukprot:PNH11077.1 hypothetical protein TSOC_002149 [Tetrabaena socialis]
MSQAPDLAAVLLDLRGYLAVPPWKGKFKGWGGPPTLGDANNGSPGSSCGRSVRRSKILLASVLPFAMEPDGDSANPRARLNCLLRGVCQHLVDTAQHANFFLRAISPAIVHDYRDFVPAGDEMHLGLIIERADAQHYESAGAFRADLARLHQNATAYNGPTGGKHAYEPVMHWAAGLLAVAAEQLERCAPKLLAAEQELQVFIKPNKVVYLPTTFVEEEFNVALLPLECELLVEADGALARETFRVTIKSVPRQGLSTMYCMTNVMRFQQQYLNWQIFNWTRMPESHIKIHLQSPSGAQRHDLDRSASMPEVGRNPGGARRSDDGGAAARSAGGNSLKRKSDTGRYQQPKAERRHVAEPGSSLLQQLSKRLKPSQSDLMDAARKVAEKLSQEQPTAAPSSSSSSNANGQQGSSSSSSSSASSSAGSAATGAATAAIAGSCAGAALLIAVVLAVVVVGRGARRAPASAGPVPVASYDPVAVVAAAPVAPPPPPVKKDGWTKAAQAETGRPRRHFAGGAYGGIP